MFVFGVCVGVFHSPLSLLAILCVPWRLKVSPARSRFWIVLVFFKHFLCGYRFFDQTRPMLFVAAICGARVLAYCGTNIQQWAFTQINWWMGSRGAKGKFKLLSYYPTILLSYYPIILSVLSVVLLSNYPICFRGFDWINLPFGGCIVKVYPIILSVSGSLKG